MYDFISAGLPGYTSVFTLKTRTKPISIWYFYEGNAVGMYELIELG